VSKATTGANVSVVNRTTYISIVFNQFSFQPTNATASPPKVVQLSLLSDEADDELLDDELLDEILDQLVTNQKQNFRLSLIFIVNV